MGQSRGVAERALSSEVVLLPTDTLLHALRVMERRRVSLLPVVEGAEEGVVGLVSRFRLLAAWRIDPLLPVGLVMTACPSVGERCGSEGRGPTR
jgi:CBS domain-containing protein